MNEPEIGPALLVHEWKQLVYRPFDETIFSIETIHDHPYFAICEGETLTHYEEPQRHAIAALALHEMPFGFTRDHLDSIQAGIVALKQMECRHSADALAAVATLIEALLPPDEWVMQFHKEEMPSVGGRMTDNEHAIDNLIHDAERAETGAKFAAVCGELVKAQRLMDKAKALYAEAEELRAPAPVPTPDGAA